MSAIVVLLAAAYTAILAIRGRIALLFTGSALSARGVSRPAVRAIHPWFGGAALALSGFQTFFGLGLLP